MTLQQFTEEISEDLTTYSLATGNSSLTGIAVVPYNMFTMSPEESRYDAVKEFVSRFGIELEQPNMFIAGYVKSNTLILSVIHTHSNIYDGIVDGMKNLNDSVFDVETGIYYTLPEHETSADLVSDAMLDTVMGLVGEIRNARKQ